MFSKKKEVKGLKKTKTAFFSKLTRAIAGKSTVDASVLDNLEEILITSDVGVKTTLKIIKRIEQRIAKDKYLNTQELNNILKEEIIDLIKDNDVISTEDNTPKNSPYVIMVVGVNGVGKTTTIGKLAYKYNSEGKKVVLGAADTFRAGAINQLQNWADRVGCSIIKQKMGSDPSSVAYDTLISAKSKNADVVIIDTAGRLHNKINLMNELSKIKKVMQKVIPDAPHDIMLILDGSTGQNAYQQAQRFSETTQITSLVVTKLDGTAKGGVVIGISDELQIPVKYIGVGEAIDNLEDFNKEAFVSSFFSIKN